MRHGGRHEKCSYGMDVVIAAGFCGYGAIRCFDLTAIYKYLRGLYLVRLALSFFVSF